MNLKKLNFEHSFSQFQNYVDNKIKRKFRYDADMLFINNIFLVFSADLIINKREIKSAQKLRTTTKIANKMIKEKFKRTKKKTRNKIKFQRIVKRRVIDQIKKYKFVNVVKNNENSITSSSSFRVNFENAMFKSFFFVDRFNRFESINRFKFVEFKQQYKFSELVVNNDETTKSDSKLYDVTNEKKREIKRRKISVTEMHNENRAQFSNDDIRQMSQQFETVSFSSTNMFDSQFLFFFVRSKKNDFSQIEIFVVKKFITQHDARDTTINDNIFLIQF